MDITLGIHHEWTMSGILKKKLISELRGKGCKGEMLQPDNAEHFSHLPLSKGCCHLRM